MPQHGGYYYLRSEFIGPQRVIYQCYNSLLFSDIALGVRAVRRSVWPQRPDRSKNCTLSAEHNCMQANYIP